MKILESSSQFDFLSHKEEIGKIVQEINNEDKNWKWKVRVLKNGIKLYWEYLEYLGEDPWIIIKWNNPEDKYDVDFKIIGDGNDLTYEIEMNSADKLRWTLRGIAHWFKSRY